MSNPSSVVDLIKKLPELFIRYINEMTYPCGLNNQCMKKIPLHFYFRFGSTDIR